MHAVWNRQYEQTLKNFSYILPPFSKNNLKTALITVDFDLWQSNQMKMWEKKHCLSYK